VDVFTGQRGVIGIGGEARSGTYEVLKSYSLRNSTPKEGRIKIVLLTPAWFSGGWQPVGGDWSPWVGTDAKLVSMALGRPLALSGWNLAKREPKPLRHFVPAGSVFFFENAHLTDKPFTESPAGEPDYGAMGYGTFAAGNWNYV
jgi:CRISPR-associated protein Cmr3